MDQADAQASDQEETAPAEPQAEAATDAPAQDAAGEPAAPEPDAGADTDAPDGEADAPVAEEDADAAAAPDAGVDGEDAEAATDGAEGAEGEADADVPSGEADADEGAAADDGDAQDGAEDAEGADADAMEEGLDADALDADALDAEADPDAAGGPDAAADGLDADADAAGGPDAAADGLDADADAAPEAVNALEPILNLVEAGGPIIVILAGLSVLSLALVLVKLVQFRLLRVGDRGFVPRVAEQLRHGDTQDALEAVQARRSVIARVMEAAIRGQRLTDDEDRVREEVTRVAQMKMDGLERGLPLLSLIATISPLLGLLGTVLGMIDAFQQLQDAGDRVDPAILSGGIWEALLTTAAGLSVAIPAAAFYTWLQRSADVCAQYMEDAATQVFTASLYRESAATAEAERADAA